MSERTTGTARVAIPSFIFASRVDGAWNVGDVAGAQSASSSARTFGLIGVVVGAVLGVLVMIWIIVALAFFAKVVRDLPRYYPTFPTDNPTAFPT